MQNYLDLMKKVMNEGKDQFNTRTNTTCRYLVGEQIKFDLVRGFPLMTTRKMYTRGIIGELLGFFRGYTSAADFRALGCNLWNDNANKTPGWLANPARKGDDDCGRLYGVQWTAWSDKRVIAFNELDTYLAKGYKKLGSFINDGYLMERRINQLEDALTLILTNPSDRRIIVNGWNPGEVDLTCLPPCHLLYTFVPNEHNDTLDVVMHQRSCDGFLGIPTNIASTSLFLSIMAKLSGYAPGQVTIQMTNFHAYSNSFDAIEEQLTRTPLELPRLRLSDNIPNKISVDEIKGVFEKITPDDIEILDYKHLDPIKVEMAV